MSDADLIAWLRAQLDDDERVARAAIAEHDGKPSWPIETVPHVGVRLLWLAVMDSTSPETMPLAMAEHISRGDPEHRLAEIDAKRRIIDTVLQYEAKIDGEWGCCHSAEAIGAGRCPDINPNEIECLRVLALPCADRPGYRDEWRP